MTVQDSEEITCPQCGNKQSVIIFQTLNADLNPSARDDLFEGKINLFDCESCEFKAFLPVPLMYHDMKRQFIVQYYPAGILEEEEFLEGFGKDGTNIMLRDQVKAFVPTEWPDYMAKPHIVFDMGELLRYVIFRERVFDSKKEDGVKTD